MMTSFDNDSSRSLSFSQSPVGSAETPSPPESEPPGKLSSRVFSNQFELGDTENYPTMDQKPWAWKKRSTEKSLIAASNSPRKCGDEEAIEVQKLVSENIELEKEVEMLNEKLSSAMCECDTKDDIAKKQVKLVEEAIAGWEKAESKVISLKQELDKVLKQKSAFEERTGQLDAALKECMHQSRLLREEHEKRNPDTVFKTSELKETKIALDEKLSENAQLIKALSIKEMAIGDLIRYKIQEDTDFKALRSRVETTEKENASLKYGSRLLEKELDIRNEEIKLNRREVDAAIKQHDESLKRIEKLETELQRLRLQMKKRLPGHSDLGRMKRDVGLLGTKDRIEAGRKKSNLSPASSAESSKCRRNVVRAFSDVESDDKTSCAKSLISELDHFENEKQMKTPSHGNLITLDMNHLMDDFAEMEKLVEFPSDAKNGDNNNNNSITIRKILELLEGINVKKPQDKGYTVRVFQWKTEELSAILERFVLTCNELLLNGTCDFGYFAREIASNLEWIVNHCFSIQDVTWGRSEWEEWRSEVEVEGGWANKEAQIAELESKDTIDDLCAEGDIGNGIEKQRILREDLEAEDMANGDELRKACRKISDLENELQNKDNSCRRLEETCHDLKIQIDSMASKETPDHGRPWEKQLQNDWEITAASEKLAECQETILNLGKQLKALASPSDRPLFDKVISTLAGDSVLASSSTPPTEDISRRSSSVVGKILAEDNVSLGASTETENDTETENRDLGAGSNGGVDISINGTGIIEHGERSNKSDTAAMDVVPCKRDGGRWFLKKLFRGRKRGVGYRNTLLIGCS